VFKKPRVDDRRLDLLQSLDDRLRVGGDDQKFPSSICHHRCGRKRQLLENTKARNLAKKRDIEGAAAEKLGRKLHGLGLTAFGKDKVLDPGKIPLHQQKPIRARILLPGRGKRSESLLPRNVPIVKVPPQGHCKSGRGPGVIIEGDVGTDRSHLAPHRGRGNRMGEGEPQRVEVVEPERKVALVFSGDPSQTFPEAVPELSIFSLRLGLVLSLHLSG